MSTTSNNIILTYRTWTQQIADQQQHHITHTQRLYSNEAISRDNNESYCQRCNGTARAQPRFTRFFTWLRNIYGAQSYSRETVNRFDNYIQLQEIYDRNQEQTAHTATFRAVLELLESIYFPVPPVSPKATIVQEIRERAADTNNFQTEPRPTPLSPNPETPNNPDDYFVIHDQTNTPIQYNRIFPKITTRNILNNPLHRRHNTRRVHISPVQSLEFPADSDEPEGSISTLDEEPRENPPPPYEENRQNMSQNGENR